MPNKIDSAGVFIGTVTESGSALTKKGLPQWIGRLTATKKFVEDKAEIEHFQKQGLLADGNPAYVDWTSFDEEIMGYLCLFKSPDVFNKETALLNYEQLKLALDWKGEEFESLGDGSHIGKSILFRVEPKSAYTNPETGKVTGGDGTLEVRWIDAADAPPNRQLKTLDTATVKAMNAKLKFSKAAPKPAAAVVPVAKPVPAPTPMVTAPTADGPSSPTASKPPKVKKTPAPAPTPAAGTELAKETDQGTAWAYVVSHKGDNEDAVVEQAWIEATQEVGENKDEADFTGFEWAKVRDIVLKDIAA
jgi:hypothetical protein